MSTTTTLGPGPRTQGKRRRERVFHDREAIHAVLDEGLVAHVGIVHEGSAVVLPMAYCRIDDAVYLHGARANRLLRNLCTPQGARSATITVTLLDGVVLARSAFHHSMNFRSMTLFGACSEVLDQEEVIRSMKALIEHVATGRWEDSRQPNPEELSATLMVRFDIEEASLKRREGPPIDDEEDYALDYWAGVVPLAEVASAPVVDPRLGDGVVVPGYALRYRRGN